MDFNQAVEHVLTSEGGLANNPVDRGGMTKFGISARAYPTLDIKNLSKDQAVNLYKKDYWDQIHADLLPEDVRLVAFDTAVNFGVEAAKNMVVQANGDPAKMIEIRQQARKTQIANDPSQAAFANTWAKRDNALKDQLVTSAQLQKPTVDRIASLMQAGHTDEVLWARQQGFSDEQIVNYFGDQRLNTQLAANDARSQDGVIATAADTLGDKFQSGVRGVQIAGNKIVGNNVAALQAQEAADRADPTKIALRGSTTGKVVGTAVDLAPTVAAAAATGGASLPVQMAVLGTAGAVQGGLRPTVNGESNINNALTEGGINAAAPGIGRVVGGVVNLGGKAIERALPKLSAEGEAIAQRLEAQGIQANRAIIAQNEGKTLGGSLLATEDDAARAATQGQLQKALLGEAGVQGETSLTRAAVEEAKSVRNALYQESVKEPLQVGGARGSFKGASIAAELQGAVRQAVDDLATSVGRTRASQSGIVNEISNVIQPLGKENFATLEPLNNAVKDLKKLARSGTYSQPEQAVARSVADKLEQSMVKRMSTDQQAKYGQAARQTQAVKVLESLVGKAETKGVVTADDITRAARSAVKGKLEDSPYYKLAQDFKKAESVQSTGKWTEKMGAAIADSLGNRFISTAAGAALGGPAGAVLGSSGIGQSISRGALNAFARSDLAQKILQRGAVPQFVPGAKTNVALIEALKYRQAAKRK